MVMQLVSEEAVPKSAGDDEEDAGLHRSAASRWNQTLDGFWGCHGLLYQVSCRCSRLVSHLKREQTPSPTLVAAVWLKELLVLGAWVSTPLRRRIKGTLRGILP